MSSSRTILGKQQWAEAALRAVARGGIAAVAVEPLARELGVTKGSFYWHFENVDALVRETIAHWEELATTRVIEELERIDDPAERLRTLLRVALDRTEHLQAEAAIAAAAGSGDARVQPGYARVSERRLAYVERSMRELGLRGADAKQRAFALFALYVGTASLVGAGVGPIESERALRAYVRGVSALLLP
ncbi:TetR/AcrR family transcriptional regulator [Sandaracinus amylolyticus]|uniref:Transcriptional regulator, TetR family protein n=1 Tax=Sandaracinus amylolyticus TaxID=927083 RepID=A0A0F6YP62_9BACT|nr:TetR/AcrR family transcriptional regulator [Sandaracinus amylolyticus]AKF11145.1 Transcriptional regulator, TetR family protein [Sandaracinus amylolyticus]